MPAHAAGGTTGKRLFTFGLVTDLQWADVEDGLSHGGSKRYYRNSLQLLKLAAEDFERAGLAFAMHLGDIVDGKNRWAAKDAGKDEIAAGVEAVGAALQSCSAFHKPWYHVIGNHCLYTLERHQIMELLGIRGQNGLGYYSFNPHPGWLFIVLDSYDVSVIGWPEGSAEYEQAKALLLSKNPNKSWNSPYGPPGNVNRRFVAYGGGVGPQQVRWLEQQLAVAKSQGQLVAVFSHCSFHPEALPPSSVSCLMWNFPEVLQVLQDSGVVVATFAGHAHKQGYCQDSTGIHHNVIPALLETPPGSLCHGFVHVCDAGLELAGEGVMESHVMPHSRACSSGNQPALAACAD